MAHKVRCGLTLSNRGVLLGLTTPVEGWVACGTPAQCIQQLQTFIEAGATDILLRFPSWDQKTQFKRRVEEVLPHFA